MCFLRFIGAGEFIEKIIKGITYLSPRENSFQKELITKIPLGISLWFSWKKFPFYQKKTRKKRHRNYHHFCWCLSENTNCRIAMLTIWSRSLPKTSAKTNGLIETKPLAPQHYDSFRFHVKNAFMDIFRYFTLFFAASSSSRRVARFFPLLFRDFCLWPAKVGNGQGKT